MKAIWKRTAYFAVGAIFTPIFLGLTAVVITHRTQLGSNFSIGCSAFFCGIAITTASAFRAAFRNPPWWITSPEETRKATIYLLRRQMVVLAKKRMILAKKSLQVAEKNLKVATKLQELEADCNDPNTDPPPPRSS